MHQVSRYKLWVLALALTSIVLTGCSLVSSSPTTIDTVASSEVTVFHSPTCGCCGLWIEHMEASGFQINDQVTEDMTAIKQQYGVPTSLRSCHTAVVDGYILEGHIPAEDIQRLLAEKPDVAGIAVPGMPTGSPGMESGNYVEPYTVFSFEPDGTATAFATHS
ncbi:MAG: DUF411 domain-containing protein [Leptolyngbya sp. SIO3F4]|nr:DUF411 domain-containing protein [Leptolyngbya sp. SIO3F4]